MATLTLRSLVLSLGCLMMMFGGIAQAKTSNEAEAQRLESEMNKLAQRNAWTGVDRTYKKLLKLKKVTIRPESHVLGGTAAKTAGDIGAAMTRFKAAGNAGSSELTWLKGAFGQVKIKKHKGDTLTPASMPFDPVKRRVIDAAAKRIKAKGKYKGWLTVGPYTLGDASFTVAANKTTKVK